MGLDSIELLVEVEKTFDIEIPDSEAKNIATVSDFYESVWNKIKDKQNNKCSSAMLFYRFRRCLQSKHDFPYNEFKPDADLNNLIPMEIRKKKWEELHQDFEYELPDLEFPVVLKGILNFIGVLIVVGTLIFAILAVNFHDQSKLLFLLPAFGLVLVMIMNLILQPLKTDIGDNTIRKFIETVLELNYKNIRLTFGTNRNEMEMIMNNIIHDKIGVDLSEIKPEASLANDLGID